MTIQMRRRALDNLENTNCQHAGLLIDRGFKEDRGNEKHNDDKMQLFADAREIAIPETYKTAFNNWQKIQIDNMENSRTWFGKLVNRMYLGMGEASPLEAGITLHHTYGVPFIPGSAIKGVISHYLDELDMDDKKQLKSILFGAEASTNDKQDSGSAGYVIFNDAWWIPEGKALAPEMVTVHAVEYYKNKGKTNLHSDFESPNPNPQIAIQGSFLFSVEGTPELADYAIALLKRAMQEKGIGGKASSGYGYFEQGEEPLSPEEEEANKWLNQTLSKVKEQNHIPDDKQGEALASKSLAEEWIKIEDQDLQKRVYQLLQNIWKENNRFPSRRAQKIYNPN